jgi:hypothetical protein
MFFSVAQVDRSCRFLRISEARAVTNHLTLIATGEEREAVRVRRTCESEEAIAINSRVTDEHFIQLFAAHAFDRITPKAFHFSNDAHCSILPRKTTATVKSIRDSPKSLLHCLAAMQCISSFPTPRLSTEAAIYNIDIMKLTKNIGMFLLAVYLIIDGLLGFGLNIGPAIFLLYIVALAAGIFILIGK